MACNNCAATIDTPHHVHCFTEWQKHATRKGLTLAHNRFDQGHSITLPNGATFHATTDQDMRDYIRNY